MLIFRQSAATIKFITLNWNVRKKLTQNVIYRLQNVLFIEATCAHRKISARFIIFMSLFS